MTNKPDLPETAADPPSRLDAASVLDRTVPVSTKTPFFQAIHAERYQRQALIKNIQKRSNRWLICYVSSGGCAIEREYHLKNPGRAEPGMAG